MLLSAELMVFIMDFAMLAIELTMEVKPAMSPSCSSSVSGALLELLLEDLARLDAKDDTLAFEELAEGVGFFTAGGGVVFTVLFSALVLVMRASMVQ